MIWVLRYRITCPRELPLTIASLGFEPGYSVPSLAPREDRDDMTVGEAVASVQWEASGFLVLKMFLKAHFLEKGLGWEPWGEREAFVVMPEVSPKLAPLLVFHNDTYFLMIFIIRECVYVLRTLLLTYVSIFPAMVLLEANGLGQL